MCSGRQWEPGKWRDDTQMALLVPGSLLEHGGLDEADMFDRFRRWAAADPKDVAIQTSAVLHSGPPMRPGRRAALCLRRAPPAMDH